MREGELTRGFLSPTFFSLDEKPHEEKSGKRSVSRSTSLPSSLSTWRMVSTFYSLSLSLHHSPLPYYEEQSPSGPFGSPV